MSRIKVRWMGFSLTFLLECLIRGLSLVRWRKWWQESEDDLMEDFLYWSPWTDLRLAVSPLWRPICFLCGHPCGGARIGGGLPHSIQCDRCDLARESTNREENWRWWQDQEKKWLGPLRANLKAKRNSARRK